MKILLSIGILLTAFISRAADTTNIIFKVTVERVISGVTNSANTSFNVVPTGSQKDVARVNGLAWQYASARALGETNSFDNWISKTQLKDWTTILGDAYNRSIQQSTAEKLTLGLSTGAYSDADVATLTTISLKAPVP